MKTFRQLEDGKVEVTETKSEEVTYTHTKEELLAQREAIEAHRLRDNEARDAELAEVDELLAGIEGLDKLK